MSQAGLRLGMVDRQAEVTLLSPVQLQWRNEHRLPDSVACIVAV